MNSQQFSRKLNNIIDSGLTIRPYNRFDPTDTIWWIVPVTDWPAFKYSKLFVNPTKTSSGFEVGLDLEKGHGKNILLVNGDTAGNRAQVMDESWSWEIISSGDINVLDDVLNSIYLAGFQPKLRLEIEPYSTERNDPDSMQAPQGMTLSYKYADGEINLINQVSAINDKDLNSFVEKILRHGIVADIFHAVAEFDKSEWYWMSLLIYFETDVIDDKTAQALIGALKLAKNGN